LCDDDDDDVNDDRGLQRYTKWSQCSKTKLTESLSQGLGICLDNVPDTYVSAQCGNGIVDDGEQCDCGLAPNAEVTWTTFALLCVIRYFWQMSLFIVGSPDIDGQFAFSGVPSQDLFCHCQYCIIVLFGFVTK